MGLAIIRNATVDRGQGGAQGCCEAFRASWWLVSLSLLVGLASALAFILLTTPLYSSSARLFVASSSTESTAEAPKGSQFPEQRIASYARSLSDESLTARVVDSLGST